MSRGHWQQQREHGNVHGILFLVWVCRHLGRRAVHAVLIFPCLFFFIFAARARQASRQYLANALGKKPSAGQVFWHIYTFGRISVDRFFFLMRKADKFELHCEGAEIFEEILAHHTGALFFLSHVGNFDALREVGIENSDCKIRLLLDSEITPNAMQVFRTLSSELAQNIIDRRQYDGPALALKLNDELLQGNMIGIMVDRIYGEERSIPLSFFGKRAHFPIGPWQLAQVLKVPVVLCFGLYCGGNKYLLKFTRLPDFKQVARGERESQLENEMRLYVQQLEETLRLQPYNWMNFYPFWIDASA